MVTYTLSFLVFLTYLFSYRRYPPPTAVEYEEDRIAGPNPYGIWLYNITADPNETNDVHNLYPEVVKTLQARLDWYTILSATTRFLFDK